MTHFPQEPHREGWIAQDRDVVEAVPRTLYTVWKIEGTPARRASEITAPDARPNAEAAALTLNAHAAEGIRYEALPLGGSPFDGAMITYAK